MNVPHTGITRSRIRPEPGHTIYRPFGEDEVWGMSSECFHAWLERSVFPAIVGGLRVMTPNEMVSTAATVKAMKARCELLSIELPEPCVPAIEIGPDPVQATRYNDKRFVRVDGDKLADAIAVKMNGAAMGVTSDETGLHRSTFQNLLSGYQGRIKPSTLETICEWLGRDPGEFRL